MSTISESRTPRRRPAPLHSSVAAQTQTGALTFNNSINRSFIASSQRSSPLTDNFYGNSSLAPQHQQRVPLQPGNRAVTLSDATGTKSFTSGSSPVHHDMYHHPQPTFHTNMDQYSQINVSNANRPNPAQQMFAGNHLSNASGNQFTRRTLSNATSSTASSTGGQSTGNRHSGIHRSGSARSIAGSGSSSPTSYVALLRKQKATVWCDRAQYEDPRLLAQQRAEKMRAAVEVVGGVHYGIGGSGSMGHHGSAGLRVSSGSSSLGGVVVGGVGVRSKIGRGSGKTISTYGAGNLSASIVPPRLIASEVDEVDSDVNSSSLPPGSMSHQRSGSGRSSLSGRRRASGYAPSNLYMTQQHPTSGQQSQQQPPSQSQSQSYPHNHHHQQQQASQYGNAAASVSEGNDAYDPDETPVPYNHRKDYFATDSEATMASYDNSNNHTNTNNGVDKGSSNNGTANGTRTGLTNGSGSGSGSSSVIDRDREQNFGRLSQMPTRTQVPAPQGHSLLQPQSQSHLQPAQDGRSAQDELRRRGSVDERTSTMTGAGRLFIANPDPDD